jgi:hypothetical protein
MDLSIVKEEIVSDVVETMAGLLVFICDGIITHISARHYESPEGPSEE